MLYDPTKCMLGVMCEFDLFGVMDCKYLKLRLSCFGRSGRNLDRLKLRYCNSV